LRLGGPRSDTPSGVRETQVATGTATASLLMLSAARGCTSATMATPLAGTSSSPSSSSEESGSSIEAALVHTACDAPPWTGGHTQNSEVASGSPPGAAIAQASSGKPPHTTSVEATRASLWRAHDDRRVVTALPRKQISGNWADDR